MSPVPKAADQAPQLSDRAAFVAWARAFRGPDHVWVRREAEDEARKLLADKVGQMTAEDAQELGRLFNTDSRDGEVRHDRFAPAFHGATLQKVIDDLDVFNDQTKKLWSADEEAARTALDQILKDPSVFPGAGRSLSTMLFYLRDRDKFVPWMDATHRGLTALTGFKGSKRQGGVAAYATYCAEARKFADEHGLDPQEIDGVLALAGRVARQRQQGHIATSDAPTLTAEAFAFLTELKEHNDGEWMAANKGRYEKSLREPFRELMEAVATRYIVDLDPMLNTKVKTGEVLAAIRKRFPDEAGPYHSYYWGAFSRGRKQEDIQLYVRIDWDSFRFGVSMGTAVKDQLERLRTAAAPRLDWLWSALEPVRDRLVFWLDDGPPPMVMDVQGPADLGQWLNGPRPAVLEMLSPNDPIVTSSKLVDEIGLVMTTVYPLAAMGWDTEVVDGDDSVEPDESEEGEAYSLAQLAHDTMLPIEDLEDWAAMLAQPSKRQAILYGPPGTGKTYVAQRLARHLAMPGGDVLAVQFHPSFSYEDFIEGLRPDEKSDQFRYAVRNGVFANFCEAARKKPHSTFVFIIDEVNRADLGSVLGELMMLLEYRGEKLPLPYSQRQFSIPRNVVVIATMNTADRSLAVVDFALRRRFHTIEMPPSREVLAAHLSPLGEEADLPLAFFDLIQKEVDSKDFSPGHTYWMGDDVSPEGLRRLWRYELKPYLAEYWFEHRARLDALEKAVGELLGEGA